MIQTLILAITCITLHILTIKTTIFVALLHNNYEAKYRLYVFGVFLFITDYESNNGRYSRRFTT
ncbi:MAG: hypothetical protein LBH32_07115 [Dysgonamonadaceae bacterium]|nr:hypothetical protein [Dysgonamonadaceae bacterium]